MGNLGNWLNLPTVILQTSLWLFAIAAFRVPQDLVFLLCIWRMDFFTKRVCNMLPNRWFGFLVGKSTFWVLKSGTERTLRAFTTIVILATKTLNTHTTTITKKLKIKYFES